MNRLVRRQFTRISKTLKLSTTFSDKCKGYNNLGTDNSSGSKCVMFSKMKVSWHKVDHSSYEATIEGGKARLIVNDFPDEPLLSLFVDDKEYIYNYVPENWNLKPTPKDK